MLKNIVLLGALLLALSAFAEQPSTNPRVLLETNLGDIELELNATEAPISVANFLYYVGSGFYQDTLFHRVIPNFMVQGGGFDQNLQAKRTHRGIKNESDNGLANLRGTIAYARTMDPDSATSQFFINLVDNAFLNGKPGKPGYTVFGKVIRGMEVVDKIARVPTTVHAEIRDVRSQALVRDEMRDVPSQAVLIHSAKRL